MKPRRDKAATPTSTSKQKNEKRRFQIVKLEERIAPGKAGTHYHKTNAHNCYRV